MATAGKSGMCTVLCHVLHNGKIYFASGGSTGDKMTEPR